MAKAKMNSILAFVDKAKSDDETRYFMNKGHYFHDGDQGKPCYVATDGHRLHVATFEDAEAAEKFGFKEDGFYDPFGERFIRDEKMGLGQFPMWTKVDPTIADPAGLASPDLPDSIEYGYDWPEGEVPRFCANTGIAVSYKFMADMKMLKNSGAGACLIRYKVGVSNKAIVATFPKSGSVELRAIIMPMSKD